MLTCEDPKTLPKAQSLVDQIAQLPTMPRPNSTQCFTGPASQVMWWLVQWLVRPDQACAAPIAWHAHPQCAVCAEPLPRKLEQLGRSLEMLENVKRNHNGGGKREAGQLWIIDVNGAGSEALFLAGAN